jgi:hypothetical protein
MKRKDVNLKKTLSPASPTDLNTGKMSAAYSDSLWLPTPKTVVETIGVHEVIVTLDAGAERACLQFIGNAFRSYKDSKGWTDPDLAKYLKEHKIPEMERGTANRLVNGNPLVRKMGEEKLSLALRAVGSSYTQARAESTTDPGAMAALFQRTWKVRASLARWPERGAPAVTAEIPLINDLAKKLDPGSWVLDHSASWKSWLDKSFALVQPMYPRKRPHELYNLLVSVGDWKAAVNAVPGGWAWSLVALLLERPAKGKQTDPWQKRTPGKADTFYSKAFGSVDAVLARFFASLLGSLDRNQLKHELRRPEKGILLLVNKLKAYANEQRAQGNIQDWAAADIMVNFLVVTHGGEIPLLFKLYSQEKLLADHREVCQAHPRDYLPSCIKELWYELSKARTELNTALESTMKRFGLV